MLRTIALAALATGWAAAAEAGCLPHTSCTTEAMSNAELQSLSCGDLWWLRNSVFADNGYCFRTARGRNVFGNAGCVYSDGGQVPMTAIERQNVERIRGVERARGCQ